ncbi:MAG TPA: hypothetical protein VFY29_11565 [Terriglobia bacterium]|nr:hypothetical protein [Terriglobia bacterium]
MSIAETELKDVDRMTGYARKILALDANNIAARRALDRAATPEK